MGTFLSGVGIPLQILPFFHFVSIIIIFGTSLLCSSILTILLMLIIFIRLKLTILWIISRLCLITRLITLSTKLTIMIWFSLNKTFFCGITIFIPIGEKLVLISVVVPIILISSSWTGDLLSCSLIFLEAYDAQLNDFLNVTVGHP